MTAARPESRSFVLRFATGAPPGHRPRSGKIGTYRGRARSGHQAGRAPVAPGPVGPLLVDADFPIMRVGATGLVQVGPRLPFIATAVGFSWMSWDMIQNVRRAEQ